MAHRLLAQRRLRPDLHKTIQEAVDDSCDIFEALYKRSAPKFKAQVFVSSSTIGICWSEVQRRPLYLKDVRIYDFLPLLRINLALFLPIVPLEVVHSTLLEELIHLHRGWDIVEPHDAVFWRMARQYRFFDDSELWKSYHVFDVLHELQEQKSHFWAD